MYMTQQPLPAQIGLPQAALTLVAQVEDATHKPVYVVPEKS